ncbi:MAG: tRNA(His) guanylyltransferase Thg1 family protein [Anaeroplasmataceae bacterium]|nr:tRNA(His) guanylyltransferase Thg1 family protein [Anaeroplasmataceae bacterium]
MYKPFKYEEEKFNLKLEKDVYYIVRFDGKDMTKDYKINKEPINEEFFKTMKETFYSFCSSKKNIIFAYSFSDEISILIKGPKNSTIEEARIEKILSLYAGELSILFFKNAQNNRLNTTKNNVFDARIIQTSSIYEYFISRQAFAIDKFIMQLKGKFNIDYKLHTSNKVLKELEKKGIKYNEFPAEYRYGLIYNSKEKLESFEFQAQPLKLKKLLN